MVDLGPAEPIDELVARVRDLVSMESADLVDAKTEAEAEAVFRNSAGALHGLVFAPLRDAIQNSTRLLISPDGALNLLPFETLTDPDGAYLIDHFVISYLSSGRDLLRYQAPADPGRGAVIFAAPDYDLPVETRAQVVAALRGETGGWPGRLPRSLQVMDCEVMPGMVAVAEAMSTSLGDTAYAPVDLRTGESALEETFEAIRQPGILAIATHGFTLEDQEAFRSYRASLARTDTEAGPPPGTENPLLRSGLLFAGANAMPEPIEGPGRRPLADGVATAEEIAGIDLWGTQLVLVGACQTGLGDVQQGEGVFGLRRAFEAAGARSLLVTLKSVLDSEASHVISRFFALWPDRPGANHLDKARALHQAKREIIEARRKEAGAAYPVYWAGFVLVGDPS
jgi:CHAT domain-containing protein